MMTAIKKAAGGFKTTTATATHNATDFIAAGARHASAGAAFHAFPCHGIGKTGKGAAKGCATVLFGASNTIDNAGNLPDSEVFSRPEFGSAGFTHLHGYGRDGLVREAGRMAYSMFSTSRPPVALEKAASGLQSQYGAETMTTVNTPPTPKTGNTSPLIRQQAIETALSDALHLVRTTGTQHGIHAATGRAIRAASMLKQACAKFAIEGGAA